MNQEISDSRRGYDESWPPVRGEYMVGDPLSGVAVVTLASILRAKGASLYGPCKTENLGIEKIVANIISNSNIRFLIICGAESKGHLPGDTIKALHKSGIDGQGRILGSRGAIPFIQNLPSEAITRFQDQVEIIDRIGLEDEAEIELLIKKYSRLAKPYPKEPFQVIKKRAKRAETQPGEGDLFLGSGVAVDTSAWLAVFQEE